MKKEKQIIGGIIFSNNKKQTLVKVSQILKDSDFKMKREFEIVKRAVLNDQDVTEQLQKNNINLSQFTEFALLDRDIEIVAKELKKENIANQLEFLLKKTAQKITPEQIKDVVSEFQSEFLKITTETEEEKTDAKHLVEEYQKEQALHAEKLEKGQKYLGIETGFEEIDKITDGIRQEHFWIIGGQPSAGKTYFTLNILSNVLKQKKRAIFYSLEMSKVDIIGRLIGINTGVSSSIALKGLTTPKNLQKVEYAKNFLYQSNLSIYSTVRDFDKMKLSILEENMKEKIDLIVIDYLQLINTEDSKEYDAQRRIAIGLQDLAKKIKTPIILISQLNQDAIKNPNSSSIGFKGGGDMEASADVGIVLRYGISKEERHEKQNKGEKLEVKIIIEKHRHGRTGFFIKMFDGSTGRYE